jgi:hypothetical protein
MYCEDKRTGGGFWVSEATLEVGSLGRPNPAVRCGSLEEAVAEFVVRELDYWSEVGRRPGVPVGFPTRTALRAVEPAERGRPAKARRATAPTQITRERIDELLRFLPLFERPPADDFVEWWGVGERNEDGVLVPPDEKYPPEVVEFYRLAGRECWRDAQCHPDEASEMLADDELVATATLAQIRTMLTLCAGSESIWRGDWGELLCTGLVARLLRRLAELRETVP